MMRTSKINYPFLIKLIIVVVLLIVAQSLVITYVNADDSYAIVEEEIGVVTMPTPEPTLIPMIEQGAIVFLNETVDISGVAPPYEQLAYWDGYDMYDKVPSYNITLPNGRSGYYKFYIDPAIFSNHLGKWYKWDGEFESNSNNLVFIVSPQQYKNGTMRFPNGTLINTSVIVKNETVRQFLNIAPEILPEKHQSDYLITTEEYLNITVNKTSAMWLFNGEDNSILYAVNNSMLVFNNTNISELAPGEYSLIIQTIGNNTQGFDVVYDNHTIKWFDQKEFVIHTIDTTFLTPDMAVRALKEIFPQTRDHYVIKHVSVQRPEVIVSRMDEVYQVSAKEFYHDVSRVGNVSVMDVRGYVNTLPGINVTVKFDPQNTYIKDQKFKTFNTTPVGTYDGNWRIWQVYIPFYWDAISGGQMHTITAESVMGGGIAYHDFMVEIAPNDSYVPQGMVKWVGDRNPWVPTPTPVIQTVITEVPVTKYVTVEVTPSDDVVKAQQKAALDEKWGEVINLVLNVIAGIVGVALVAGLVYYLYTVYRRGKKK